jgi:ubiquinone/menaquinone biosynthesis C-methylase UbiE
MARAHRFSLGTSCDDAVVTDATSAPVAAVFDRAADTYDAAIPFFSRFGQRLVELADVGIGETVLDLASGRGASLIPAARAVGAGGRVIGVDLAPRMVDLLTQDLQRLGMTQACAVVGDATHLDVPDNEFDVALCGFTLMLLPEPDRAAAELARTVRPGGRVAVSLPTGAGPEWSFYGELITQFAPRAIRPLPPMPGPPLDLAEVLGDVGFEQVRSVDEVEAFVFANTDAWWTWAWSQGMRAVLETLPSDALDELRRAGEQRLQPITSSDGSIPLHQRVRYLLASKPQST